MKKYLLFLSMVFVINIVFGQTKNFIDQAYLETTTQVDTLVTPDKIFLSIIISESDTKGKQTLEELEKKMLVKLKESGIELASQLSLLDLSSNFKNYFLRKQDIFKAKSFELLVYDAKTAGRAIYEMEAIGISNVDLDRTEYSAIDTLKLKLKSKAVLKAKVQAEAMVAPLDQKLGNVIFISDIESSDLSSLQGRTRGVQIVGYSEPNFQSEFTPIEFEKIKVESKVTVKFAIN